MWKGRACWIICWWRERGYVKLLMMVYNIGLSLTWLLLANGCIPDIFINLVSTHHCLNAKLARHHFTFTCDVGEVSMHPVWEWLCDCRTAQIFCKIFASGQAVKTLSRKNFSPYGTSHVLFIPYKCTTCVVWLQTTVQEHNFTDATVHCAMFKLLVHTFLIYLYIYEKLNEFIVRCHKKCSHTQSLCSMLSIV